MAEDWTSVALGSVRRKTKFTHPNGSINYVSCHHWNECSEFNRGSYLLGYGPGILAIFLAKHFELLFVCNHQQQQRIHHLMGRENSFCRIFPLYSASDTVHLQRLKHSGIFLLFLTLALGGRRKALCSIFTRWGSFRPRHQATGSNALIETGEEFEQELHFVL